MTEKEGAEMTKRNRKKPCEFCNGDGWVCEDHPKIAWKDGNGCCGGAGMPCECNKDFERPYASFKEAGDEH